MISSTVALLLFALVAWRFVRRATQEARRQRALTWPRATAVLNPETAGLEPAAANRLGDVLFYRARLREPYVFYARGERFTGHRLAPELERLNPEETKLFLRALQQHARYQICYDPNDPEHNYLTVGRHLLSNRSLLLYAVFGLALPACLLVIGVYGTPATLVQELVIVGTVLGSTGVLLAAYYAAKSVLNVGTYLVPTPERPSLPAAEPPDELLESLAERAFAAPASPQKISRA
ncbi:hypothetical protein LEM8419_02396 [Neolewinella maritima]|uniref:DUF3592 domain-containing protein n=1 Tax=Neolewinella maritima TaxID=1383882 RepID=A0ABN8F3F8_9BACT|nr:hypothetical protein [Neolewinella maritima]CAH1001493.1 hypothetical protein LEM8419_02396 [Neolewinella maritima]